MTSAATPEPLLPTPSAEPALRRAWAVAPAGLTLIGGFLACVAVFMPWAVITSSSNGVQVMTGFDVQNDGLLALALGIITLGFGVAAMLPAATHGFVRRAPLVLGVLIGWLAFAEEEHFAWWHAYTQQWSQDTNWATMRMGLGLDILFLAAILTVVAGCWRKPRRG